MKKNKHILIKLRLKIISTRRNLKTLIWYTICWIYGSDSRNGYAIRRLKNYLIKNMKIKALHLIDLDPKNLKIIILE